MDREEIYEFIHPLIQPIIIFCKGGEMLTYV